MDRPVGIGHNGGPPLDDDMDGLYASFEGKSVQDILREGQKALFINLVSKVRSGQASHNEMAILRNLLKDNGMVLGIPPEEPIAARNAPADLPEFETPDYE